MVEKLFSIRKPRPESSLLDPGCGPGAFIDGVLRWCARHGVQPPRITGVDLNPTHVRSARARFVANKRVQIEHSDFLKGCERQFDFVIGNPPYVSIEALSEDEKSKYRLRYKTATNRFDLYALFFEEALRQLNHDGVLVFITPEKFLYVESAAALRRLLLERSVEELHFLPENTFGDLVTYPLVTTIHARARAGTSVVSRNGDSFSVHLPLNGSSWMPALARAPEHHGATLGDIATRISCGVATGSDRQFVVPANGLPHSLFGFSFPTVSGRQLNGEQDLAKRHRLLVPYDRSGALIPEEALGALRDYLSVPERKSALLARTCVRRKPWYAFHENPPMTDILQPKILCKDIGSVPQFYVDVKGEIVPRHSVYYIVPREKRLLLPLATYLNSRPAKEWLIQNCQRAAMGFIRLQSHVLKKLPIPADIQFRFAGASAYASVPTPESPITL